MTTQPTLVLVPGLDGTGLLFKPLLEEISPAIESIIIQYPPDKILSKKTANRTGQSANTARSTRCNTC